MNNSNGSTIIGSGLNIERRIDQRRVWLDRRSTIRFTIDKENRRTGRDRRSENNIWADQMRWN